MRCVRRIRVAVLLLLGLALLGAGCGGGSSPGAPSDTATPGGSGTSVVSASPSDGAAGVALREPVVVVFQDPVQSHAVTVAPEGGSPVSGQTVVAGNTVTFTPSADYAVGTRYVATVSVSTGRGNGTCTLRFTTASHASSVVSMYPSQGGQGASVDRPIVVVVSDPVQSATVTVAPDGGSPVAGRTDIRDNTVIFVPTVDLPAHSAQSVTVSIRTAFSTVSRSWSFTTGPAPTEVLRGVLSVDGALGVSLAGAEVRTEDASATADADGRYAFPSLSSGKRLLVAEKRFGTGAVRRVLGILTVYPVEGYSIRNDLRMADFTDGYTYCLGCHPLAATRPGQVARCLPMSTTREIPCEECHTLHRNVGYPNFRLTIESTSCNHCHGVSVQTAGLQDGTVGSAYRQALEATGGGTPYTWTVSEGSLPAGLGLDSATGVISGIPTEAGFRSFKIQVRESHGFPVTQPLSIAISSP